MRRNLAAAVLLCGSIGCGLDREAGPTSPPRGSVEDDAAFAPLWSTYMGGDEPGKAEMGRDVAVDASGRIFVVGSTQANNFPVTPGGYDVTLTRADPDYADAFVRHYNGNGQLIWSTYLGGNQFERAYAIEVAPSGHLIVAGRAGANFPVTAGAFDQVFGGGLADPLYGEQDGFVCKMTADPVSFTTGEPVWCSYFGVDDGGIIRDVAVDANGDILIASALDGDDATEDFPTAWFTNAPAGHKVPTGGRDVIIAKISGDGTTVLWAFFLGGSNNEFGPPSVRVDAAGNVYAATVTQSTDMEVTNGTSLHGISDGYVVKISADGTTLLYGTYLGGGAQEEIETHNLAVTAGGVAYFSGATLSSDLATAMGIGACGADNTYSGGGFTDAFVVRLTTAGTPDKCTYVGGNDTESPQQGIAISAGGHVVISGLTKSTGFAMSRTYGPLGLTDVLVGWFSADLSTVVRSYRIGGPQRESGRGIALIGTDAVVTGTTDTPFPTLNADDTATGSPVRSEGLLFRVAGP